MYKDMKKYSLILAALAILGAASVSCDKVGGTKSISVSAVISEEGIAEELPRPDSYDVTFTNTTTMQSVTVKSENGIAVATGIIPGIYNISAAGSAVEGSYSYYYAGSAQGVSLLEDNDNVTLTVVASKESALILKEIYYTGCKVTKEENGETTENNYFRDQFYEIYNNSPETVYVDGLCFAIQLFASYDYSIVYDFDIENKDNYVFTQNVWQIPGDGTKYPLKPGESIVLAQWATDHKAADLTAGQSPVDLSGAEFEFFIKAGPVWGATLTDGDAVNLERVSNAMGYPGIQYLTSTSGCNYLIFKPSQPVRTSDYIVPTNDTPTVNNYAIEILRSDIIDAVQAISGEDAVQNIGMPASLDAGYIWCSNDYSGESISRKVKETLADGRVVYQDTNNTSNDFVLNSTPEIRRGGAKVPSWNTWIK